MVEVIAGIAVPSTSAANEATRVVRESVEPVLFHHSRRVYLFGALSARSQGLDPDLELLYLAALFHDTGLSTPFSDVEQRFELDGADHARAFLHEQGFSEPDADVVWTAIALHTTPGIPPRMGPEVAAMASGVLTDVMGLGLEDLDGETVDEVLATHPRGDFKHEFLRVYLAGLVHRPDTAYGTVNADVLEHFVPTYRRANMVERVLGSPWPS